jgi:transposase
MRKTRTHYSEEFKTKAVALVIQRGNLLAVSRELNVSKGTLLLWKRNYESGILNSGGRSYEQEEITRLRKELKDVQLERDILKKAVSIFSKSDR